MSGPTSTLAKQASALWKSSGTAARYVNAENATRPYAKCMVDKARFATLAEPIHVLDLATGTGVVVQELYNAVPREKWDNINVLGADINRDMLSYLQERGEKQGWKGLKTEVVDGSEEIKLPASSFTHITLSFAIFAMPDVLPALFKLLKPGGFIGVSTGANVAWYPLLRDSIAKMRDAPECPSLSALEAALYRGRDWSSAEYVAEQLRGSGFVEVDTVQSAAVVKAGTPKMFVETMQFPLMVLKWFWGEDKWEERLAELNEVMLREAVERAAGEEELVEMHTEGIVGWGQRAQ